MEQQLPVMNKPSLHIRLRRRLRKEKRIQDFKDFTIDQAAKEIHELNRQLTAANNLLRTIFGARVTYNPHKDNLVMCVNVERTLSRRNPVIIDLAITELKQKLRSVL
jgi:hypothetical protein